MDRQPLRTAAAAIIHPHGARSAQQPCTFPCGGIGDGAFRRDQGLLVTRLWPVVERCSRLGCTEAVTCSMVGLLWYQRDQIARCLEPRARQRRSLDHVRCSLLDIVMATSTRRESHLKILLIQTARERSMVLDKYRFSEQFRTGWRTRT